ncbi:hypothetical protein QBC33DRAFT_334528 [Phialemonium atrogriseum]|uniref:Glutaredoxin domain-containing protein n=1 Tax=Phialemonium atrogriseum TaxID=1093897 RepID=A0AAJ0FP55_9PEZI|nr:uncharacterized protein QBC33DRAFT_334528 [Phialemonium atrogriseum]KAK1769739.1 hypothetical protein QBC33DRAFT_334528 [Phialemonium atrogriseum]
MASSDPASSKSYSTDPALYIYTSLTAGSSHIVTATSRLETILRANRVPFKAIDLATDEKARMLWGRRAGKDESGRVRKLPGLVQMGLILGDLVEIEDWNEYGELKQHVTIYYDEFTQPSITEAPKLPTPFAAKPATVPSVTNTAAPAAPAAPAGAAAVAAAAAQKASTQKQGEGANKQQPEAPAKVTMPIRSIAEEAAAKAKQVHLQSLRNKVYGKGKGPGEGPGEGETSTKAVETDGADADKDKDDKPQDDKPALAAAVAAVAGVVAATVAGGGAGEEGGAGKEEEAGADKEPREEATTAAAPSTPPPASAPASASASTSSLPLSLSSRAAGLQSPTTGTWADGAAGGVPLRTLQSPTTTSWRPTDVEPPVTSYRGSVVSSASADEIEAVERAEMIKEEDEPEEDEDEGDRARGTSGAKN